MSSFGNRFQGQLNCARTPGAHDVKWGAEARLNRDSTYFGMSPNGEYDFGGGTVYSPVFFPSASGQHNIAAGDPPPDTLSSLLLGYPYAYTVAVAPPYSSNGAHIGAAAINRNDVNACIQDTWKIHPHWTLDYGLRYELYTPTEERAHRLLAFSTPIPLRASTSSSPSIRSRLIQPTGMDGDRACRWHGAHLTRFRYTREAPSLSFHQTSGRIISSPAPCPTRFTRA